MNWRDNIVARWVEEQQRLHSLQHPEQHQQHQHQQHGHQQHHQQQHHPHQHQHQREQWEQQEQWWEQQQQEAKLENLFSGLVIQREGWRDNAAGWM